MTTEERIADIRKGLALGCTRDDMYDELVLTGEITEGEFFLLFVAACMLSDGETL